MASFGDIRLILLGYFLVRMSRSMVAQSCQGKLVFSSILYRHGDRTPVAFYPTDPYSHPNDWPVGTGQLTNIGKQQHYKLGQWLRARYSEDFLPRAYNENKIYVRSTDMDRTIASALCNLAGLFPPAGNQIWNDTIHWQPIPVHSVPASVDYVLGPSLPPCPAYDQAFARLMASPEIQKCISQYQPQIQYALQNAGASVNGSTFYLLVTVLLIRDTLFVETLYNKRLPAWTKSIYPSDWSDRLAMLFYILPAYTPELAKFQSGFFFKDVLDRSTSKVNGTLSPDYSVYVYSAHDLNISTLLKSLGMWNNQFVQYTATLLFEVRILGNVPYMEIFYKQSSNTETAQLLFIPNCGYSCPLKKLYQIFANILPQHDFHTECRLQE